MAGSRLERFGTVFTRVRDLMRSGVIKQSEKPIWYDVYEAFPPKRDPRYVKPHARHDIKKQETVSEIFYREDKVRAFVEKYTELKSNSEMDDSALFTETGKALLKEGLILRRKEIHFISEESRSPVLELELTDMLAEQQAVGADTDTPHTS
ncbi:small ribosomal subunit protein mS23 isoform X2 [Stegastes partitus]|uniref:Small ribosomal subunit protein mS23 n=1 Tax=Stegastes partitus TaxID=144197 RepID=A0A9Y4MVN6_9TELE|nr:PREDICTED: 28S ribosomal protein S23, mitochondrial isoform X2 [Stegastes partitus]